jgi:hypothetical protein
LRNLIAARASMSRSNTETHGGGDNNDCGRASVHESAPAFVREGTGRHG